jgi:D-tyrosyl-tRNA(Tyr) deacylase
VIGLLQRVSQARVMVEGRCTGAIGTGLLLLVCAERGDSVREAAGLLAKLLSFRVFPDDAGRMNRSLRDLAPAAGLLIVPQFTLAADTRSGTRPSFTPGGRAGGCASPIRAFRQPGARRVSYGRNRRVWRRHEGSSCQ